MTAPWVSNQPTSTTAIPGAYDSLLAIVTAAVPEGVGVYDVTVPQGAPDSQYVRLIGWQSESLEPATIGGPTSFSIDEQFGLTGEIWVADGSSQQRISRLAAFVIFNAVQGAVTADPTLGGTVRVSWISSNAGQQGVPDGARGNGTEIAFTVHCESRLN